jgi:hypothetical protein
MANGQSDAPDTQNPQATPPAAAAQPTVIQNPTTPPPAPVPANAAAKPAAPVAAAPSGGNLFHNLSHALIGGILGAALGPKTEAQYNVDPATGKLVTTQAPLTTGDRLRRLAAGALRGLGAAATAPPRPGAPVLAGLGAGATAEMKEEKAQDLLKRQQAAQNFEQEQRTTLMKANIANLNAQTINHYMSAIRAGEDLDPVRQQNQKLVDEIQGVQAAGELPQGMSVRVMPFDDAMKTRADFDAAKGKGSFLSSHIVLPMGRAPDLDPNTGEPMMGPDGKPKTHGNVAIISGLHQGMMPLPAATYDLYQEYGERAGLKGSGVGEIQPGQPIDVQHWIGLENALQAERVKELGGWQSANPAANAVINPNWKPGDPIDQKYLQRNSISGEIRPYPGGTPAGVISLDSLITTRNGDIFAKLRANPKLLDDPATLVALQGIVNDPNANSVEKEAAGRYIDQAAKANVMFVNQQRELAAVRGQSYNQNRPINVIENGQLVVRPAGEAEAKSLTPAAGGVKAMSQQAQIADIRAASQNLRTALRANAGTQFTPDQVAKITLAMSEADPKVMANEIKNLAAAGLNPAQQDLVTWLAQMQERVLSIRNIAGMGQGSDLTRLAILNTLPTITSGNNAMALKRLDAIDNMINNLSQGIPKTNVPITPTPVGQLRVTATDPKTNHQIYTEDGGKTWLDSQTNKPIAPAVPPPATPPPAPPQNVPPTQ